MKRILLVLCSIAAIGMLMQGCGGHALGKLSEEEVKKNEAMIKKAKELDEFLASNTEFATASVGRIYDAAKGVNSNDEDVGAATTTGAAPAGAPATGAGTGTPAATNPPTVATPLPKDKAIQCVKLLDALMDNNGLDRGVNAVIKVRAIGRNNEEAFEKAGAAGVKGEESPGAKAGKDGGEKAAAVASEKKEAGGAKGAKSSLDGKTCKDIFEKPWEVLNQTSQKYEDTLKGLQKSFKEKMPKCKNSSITARMFADCMKDIGQTVEKTKDASCDSAKTGEQVQKFVTDSKFVEAAKCMSQFHEKCAVGISEEAKAAPAPGAKEGAGADKGAKGASPDKK